MTELKDGDAFDTKKSDGEHETLITVTESLSRHCPDLLVDYRLCCFNQQDKARILTGLKGRFDVEHVMTGRELCSILGTDFDEICESRKSDAIKNRQELVRELLSVTWFRDIVMRELKK